MFGLEFQGQIAQTQHQVARCSLNGINYICLVRAFLPRKCKLAGNLREYWYVRTAQKRTPPSQHLRTTSCLGFPRDRRLLDSRLDRSASPTRWSRTVKEPRESSTCHPEERLWASASTSTAGRSTVSLLKESLTRWGHALFLFLLVTRVGHDGRYVAQCRSFLQGAN